MKLAFKQRISAIQATRRPGFVVNFAHPKNGRRVSRSLQTRDESHAKQIALDLERLARTPALWSLKPADTRLQTFDIRALEIFFDAPVNRLTPASPISDEMRAAIAVLAEAGLLPHVRKLEERNPELEEEREQRVAAEQRALSAERALQDMELELQRYRRAANRHISATLQDARDAFFQSYPAGHAETTVRMVFSAVTKFVEEIGPEKNLGKVRSQAIDLWLRNYKSADGGAVSAVTRKRRKAYLSVFWRWARREYDLAENPMSNTAPIAGAQRHPEHIRAIRRLEEIEALLEALSPWPYWRAWVATAILAGPRWSEQAWLKVEDVYIKEGYLRIATRTSGPKVSGTKTGRERNIPIEKTILLPILKAHLEAHDGRYPWLFPSSLDCSVPRKKTPLGLWSGSSAFLDAWKPVAEAVRKKAGAQGEFWSFGPSEWRHTFGTALGMCGFSSLEISRLMGNSPQIAERHYIAIRAEDAGRRWPYKWT